MKFYTRPREVQAQQFKGNLQAITIVQLELVPGLKNIFRFLDDTNEYVCVLPYDWIVSWQDGTINVLSEFDFDYRFSKRDTLKESLRLVKAVRTRTPLEKLVDDYLKRQE